MRGYSLERPAQRAVDKWQKFHDAEEAVVDARANYASGDIGSVRMLGSKIVCFVRERQAGSAIVSFQNEAVNAGVEGVFEDPLGVADRVLIESEYLEKD